MQRMSSNTIICVDNLFLTVSYNEDGSIGNLKISSRSQEGQTVEISHAGSRSKITIDDRSPKISISNADRPFELVSSKQMRVAQHHDNYYQQRNYHPDDYYYQQQRNYHQPRIFPVRNFEHVTYHFPEHVRIDMIKNRKHNARLLKQAGSDKFMIFRAMFSDIPHVVYMGFEVSSNDTAHVRVFNSKNEREFASVDGRYYDIIKQQIDDYFLTKKDERDVIDIEIITSLFNKSNPNVPVAATKEFFSDEQKNIFDLI